MRCNFFYVNQHLRYIFGPFHRFCHLSDVNARPDFMPLCSTTHYQYQAYNFSGIQKAKRWASSVKHKESSVLCSEADQFASASDADINKLASTGVPEHETVSPEIIRPGKEGSV